MLLLFSPSALFFPQLPCPSFTAFLPRAAAAGLRRPRNRDLHSSLSLHLILKHRLFNYSFASSCCFPPLPTALRYPSLSPLPFSLSVSSLISFRDSSFLTCLATRGGPDVLERSRRMSNYSLLAGSAFCEEGGESLIPDVCAYDLSHSLSCLTVDDWPPVRTWWSS